MAKSTGQAVSASAPKSGGGGEGKLTSINIEVETNGFTVNCSHAGKKTKGDYPSYSPPVGYVFESAEKAMEFVAGKLGVKAGAAEKK